jgi:hypothetical protein
LAGDDDYLRGATSINHQVALRANFKMYSRSAKGGEKGDPNCNPWLAKMFIKVQHGICSTIVRYFDNYVVWFLSVPVDGEWGEWRHWTCSVTCGTGIDTRTRLCDNPAPADDGNDCTGPSSETRACVLHPCRKLFI